MKRLLMTISCILLVLPLAVTAAEATESWSTGKPVEPLEPSVLRGGCVLGNTNPITIAGPILPVGGSTCLVIDPNDGCASCSVGFEPTSIDANLWVENPADCDVTVRITFRTPEGSADPACPEPAKVECISNTVLRKLSPGANEVSVPFKCACADMNFSYILCMELVSSDCASVQRMASDDGGSDPCTSWYIEPDGDLVDESTIGIPGRLGITAGAECCNKPVANEDGSWGQIKGLYEE